MYKSIAAAGDWFYVIAPDPKLRHDKLIVWRLAAWALTEDNNVIGLVRVYDAHQYKRRGISRPNSLVSVPQLHGIYKHDSELTEEERSVLFGRKAASNRSSTQLADKKTKASDSG